VPSIFCPTCLYELGNGEACGNCASAAANGSGDTLPIGTILSGKFQLGGLLGRGGFGATYLALDLNLNTRVAIKEYFPAHLASRVAGAADISPLRDQADAYNAGLSQFLQEARNLVQFRGHQTIIHVLEFFSENNTGYLVMEFLDGQTLLSYAASVGRIDPVTALNIILPVADALKACHAVGLIHRDISPDNIFLTNDGNIKLLDFGAARVAIGLRSTNLSVILKPGYAPFEQYQSKAFQGPATDIYALCATLYRLIAGTVPVNSPDRIGGTPLDLPSALGISISAGLEQVIVKGMALEYDKRYPDIAAFLVDARLALEGKDVAADAASSPNPRSGPAVFGGKPIAAGAPLPWPGNMPRGVLVGTAAAVLTVVLGLLYYRPFHPYTAQTPPGGQSGTGSGIAQGGDVTPRPPDFVVTGVNPIDQTRSTIRHALQYLAAMQGEAFKAKKNQISLDALRKIPEKDEKILESILALENVQASLKGDEDRNMANYIDEIQTLARVKPSQFNDAAELEQTSTLGSAVDVIRRHAFSYVQGHLSAELVNNDIDKLNGEVE